jgi:p-hydroxybenzoate 3-monooxygenase
MTAADYYLNDGYRISSKSHCRILRDAPGIVLIGQINDRETGMRTQVAIVGAGPAGLLLSHLLRLQGIDSVLIETRSREYCENRIRAGVLEQGTVDTLNEAGLGERMKREGLVHHGIELLFSGQRHRIDLTSLTGGRAITVYGQHEVVCDLIAAASLHGQKLVFDVGDVSLHDVASGSPEVHFTHDGSAQRIECDYIAGCDGFHGISRTAIPADVLRTYERVYPYAWLGILADAPPTLDELVYAHHERGFALFSMRSPTVTRLYLQCRPDEDLAQWPDARVWSELHTRFSCEDGWTPGEGPITQKSVTPMRSFVA